MAAPSQTRVYCCVYGCLNSSLNKPTLSFFQLPTDVDRRNEWLRLISREDLGDDSVNPKSLKVCSEHFKEQDFLPGNQRNKLKNTAIPIINLPAVLIKDATTQTGTHTNRGVQTYEAEPVHKNTQTTQQLLLNTPLVKRLQSELSECKKQVKLNQISGKSTKVQKAMLHELSDNLLSKQLAMIVKASVDLKASGDGNRYDEDYIKFCSDLYDTSPVAYGFLRNALCLPWPTTLSKLRTRKPNDLEAATSANTSNLEAATSANTSNLEATTSKNADNFEAMISTMKNNLGANSTNTQGRPTFENTNKLETNTNNADNFSFLRGALSTPSKVKTRTESNLESASSTHTSSSLAMIVCDIPPEYSDPIQYDPFQM